MMAAMAMAVIVPVPAMVSVSVSVGMVAPAVVAIVRLLRVVRSRMGVCPAFARLPRLRLVPIFGSHIALFLPPANIGFPIVLGTRPWGRRAILAP